MGLVQGGGGGGTGASDCCGCVCLFWLLMCVAFLYVVYVCLKFLVCGMFLDLLLFCTVQVFSARVGGDSCFCSWGISNWYLMCCYSWYLGVVIPCLRMLLVCPIPGIWSIFGFGVIYVGCWLVLCLILSR